VYEHRSHALAPRPVFIRRVARSALLGLGIVAGSLAIGTAGYHFLAGLPWLDAVLNAAMILTGMGPVDKVESAAGKIFATCYALYSGVAFLTTMALVLAPVLHRFLHRFHLHLEGDRDRSQRQEKP